MRILLVGHASKSDPLVNVLLLFALGQRSLAVCPAAIEGQQSQGHKAGAPSAHEADLGGFIPRSILGFERVQPDCIAERKCGRRADGDGSSLNVPCRVAGNPLEAQGRYAGKNVGQVETSELPRPKAVGAKGQEARPRNAYGHDGLHKGPSVAKTAGAKAGKEHAKHVDGSRGHVEECRVAWSKAKAVKSVVE